MRACRNFSRADGELRAAVHFGYTNIGVRIALIFGCAFSVCAACSFGGTIDVSSQPTQLLQSGDALEFLFSTRSYAAFATGVGMPAYPAAVDFTFAVAPVSVLGQFSVSLESMDGSICADFPDLLTWTAGYAQSSGYSGPVSALVESLALSSDLSQSLFAGGMAELILTYSGSAVMVGMQGKVLQHDLQTSLVGPSFSVGGLVYSANLVQNTDPSVLGTDPSAPEPLSWMLLLAGASLCLIRRASLRQVRNCVSSPLI